MANAGKLEVQIGADITDFEKKIKEVESDIRDLSKLKLDRLKLGLDTKELNAQIKDAKNALRTLKDSNLGVSNSFDKMAPKVANGGNALMQFSRIAQDAPYGIIGIGNNITATVEAFGHLKNSTGTAGGALKAMASSLMGTGGILLGVSLLTTGFTLLAQSGLSVGDIIDKVTGKFDAFGQSVTKMAVDSAKNSGQEIAGIKALVSVAQDDLKSRKDRLTAIEELQNKYPAYFGNLTKEQLLTGDLTTVTKELAKAIIARAEASAIADKIGELASKKLELQIKREKEIIALQKTQKNVSDAEKNLKTANNIAGAGQRAAGAAGAYALAAGRVKDFNQEIYDIQAQQDKLAGRLNQKTSDSIKLLEKKASIEKQKVVKTFDTPQVSGLQSTIIPAPLFDVAGIAVFNGQIDKFGNKIKELPGIIKTSMAFVSGSIVTPLSDEMIRATEAMIQFNENLNAIINGALMDTFAGIGNAIGTALSTGGNILNALGTTLLSSLGGVLTQMGKMAIEIGVGLLAVKLALKTLNPYAAIAAGIGLVALGSFFSSKSASISNSMGGGGNTSTSTGSGANNNTSTSGGGYGLSGGGTNTVVFEIAGTSLIGVLNNTTSRNLRLGGRS